MAPAKFNNAPHLYGRKIFRPCVRQRCPVTQPSNIATPQIVAPATRRRTMDVRAKYFSPVRAPLMRHRPTIKQLPHHKSWCTANLTTRRICRGEIFFAPACAIDAQSPNHQPSNIAAPQIAAPATRRRTMDVRAKYFSPVRAPSIHHHPTINHRHTINRGARRIKQRNAFVRAKNISPLRAPLMRHRPHIVVARPQHATAPRMDGRNIFRPYVCD